MDSGTGRSETDNLDSPLAAGNNIDKSDIHEIEPGDEIILPTFSVIIPTYKDPEALRRTLANLIIQSCDDEEMFVARDLLIIGDGYEKRAEKVCAETLKAIEKMPHIRLGYYYVKHQGHGNLARAAGLRKAERDWVVFCDSGTAVQKEFFKTLVLAILQNPEAKFATWDMWQGLDPAPVLASAKAIFGSPRENGLPYVLPGCATAVRRTTAQLIDWPQAPASDWVYFSQLWDKLYLVPDLITGGTKRIDTVEQIDVDVVAIPWTLTAAYTNRSTRKVREMPTVADMHEEGWTMGYNQARQAALEKANEQSETDKLLPGT